MTAHVRRRDSKRQPRGDRTAVERVSDPYRVRGKWPEPTMCPQCNAIYHRGRWQWGVAAPDAERHLCPACLRIRDRLPAGRLTLSGDFYRRHRDEISHLVHNAEAKARVEHPLERIMDVVEEANQTVITFTDGHLARGIGAALHHAYGGELDSLYTDKTDLLRVAWKR